MKFTEMLEQRWRDADSMLCVGLDPNPDRMPASVQGRVGDFCRAIVEATADLVCAFKPQIAYFAAMRALPELEELIAYIHERHPGIPVILDAKRGDIGSTAKAYAREAFEIYGADAVTVSPYMGFDTVEPYLEYEDRGVILLCRTSNPGGRDIEMLQAGGRRVFEHVAAMAAQAWKDHDQLGLVVGATFPEEMAGVRAIAPGMPFLVPGIGAQGGDILAAVRAGLDRNGRGMIINSSRAVIYAGSGPDFAQAARRKAAETRDAIRRARSAVLGTRS
ncbi:orotidine-5'-phosphate decarboxylase [Mesosutterella sp. AGMB02718]|uniref:Orotidine 5'-phosphate decarboxylase n=1 Tax=Mesosutterella faecium TaxID=2925194 RepID=A0ABT7IJW0_9BURK|nr:orotidine-5'-phosphate decarboxylase [Mesosutterella sp. AGMB02718]MDL2058658.1 orotidine-5'-phosphate decarboxylase [Mesosutterella sp. AGMB02718]